MKKKNYKEWKAEDLKKEIVAKREALRVFRFGESGSRTRNVREGRTLRREIGSMLTELRKFQVAQSGK